jgi:type II secretion system protein G
MKKAFTLLELLVVVLILGILSTIAVGVFTSQVERARFAAAKATISAIELAVNRYEIDLGSFPPSGTGTSLPPATPSSGPVVDGCGYMQLALMHSLNGSSTAPLDPRWQGPYLTVKKELLGDSTGTPIEEIVGPQPGLAEVQILDPWHAPYRYIRFGPAPDGYGNYGFVGGGTVLPTTHPFFATETYYNPQTFQIVSKGPNGYTPAPPNFGTDPDDVTNFGQ